eukprot:6227937-Prymnesium_polylepis.1
MRGEHNCSGPTGAAAPGPCRSPLPPSAAAATGLRHQGDGFRRWQCAQAGRTRRGRRQGIRCAVVTADTGLFRALNECRSAQRGRARGWRAAAHRDHVDDRLGRPLVHGGRGTREERDSGGDRDVQHRELAEVWMKGAGAELWPTPISVGSGRRGRGWRGACATRLPNIRT